MMGRIGSATKTAQYILMRNGAANRCVTCARAAIGCRRGLNCWCRRQAATIVFVCFIRKRALGTSPRFLNNNRIRSHDDASFGGLALVSFTKLKQRRLRSFLLPTVVIDGSLSSLQSMPTPLGKLWMAGCYLYFSLLSFLSLSFWFPLHSIFHWATYVRWVSSVCFI